MKGEWYRLLIKKSSKLIIVKNNLKERY